MKWEEEKTKHAGDKIPVPGLVTFSFEHAAVSANLVSPLVSLRCFCVSVAVLGKLWRSGDVLLSAHHFFVYALLRASSVRRWGLGARRASALALPAQAPSREACERAIQLQGMLEGHAEAVGVREGALEEVVVEGRRVLQENTVT